MFCICFLFEVSVTPPSTPNTLNVKLFEEKLDVEIQIYNFECRQIYKGNKSEIKIFILMAESHFDNIFQINDKNDQVNQTGLLNKADMIAKQIGLYYL